MSAKVGLKTVVHLSSPLDFLSFVEKIVRRSSSRLLDMDAVFFFFFNLVPWFSCDFILDPGSIFAMLLWANGKLRRIRRLRRSQRRNCKMEKLLSRMAHSVSFFLLILYGLVIARLQHLAIVALLHRIAGACLATSALSFSVIFFMHIGVCKCVCHTHSSREKKNEQKKNSLVRSLKLLT